MPLSNPRCAHFCSPVLASMHFKMLSSKPVQVLAEKHGRTHPVLHHVVTPPQLLNAHFVAIGFHLQEYRTLIVGGGDENPVAGQKNGHCGVDVVSGWATGRASSKWSRPPVKRRRVISCQKDCLPNAVGVDDDGR